MRGKSAALLRRNHGDFKRVRIQPVGRTHWSRIVIPLILVLSLLPFYWISFQAPATGTIHDDGIYLVTAKALAEGNGYRIISLPGDPKQTKYPIGFPLLLAGIWKLFPEFPANVPILKVVPIGAWMAWIGMSVYLARRWGRLSWEATVWVLFFCAGTHWAIFGATNFMSDLLFGALALLCLHFLLRIDDESPEHAVRTALFAALACAAAYSVRTSAGALMLAGTYTLLLRRRLVPAALFVGISMAAVLPWAIWQHRGPHFSNPIQAYYTAQNYSDWNLLTAPYPGIQKATVLLTNVFHTLTFPVQIVLSDGTLLPWAVALALGTAVWAFYLRGMLANPQLRTAHICFAIYAGLLLLWAWPPDRFLTSLLPVFAIVVCLGLPRRFKTLYWGALAAGVLLFTGWTTMRAERSSGIAWMKADRRLDWSGLTALHDWVRAKTKPEAVVMANFDPAVYLYTGRKAIRPYELDNLGLFYGLPGNPLHRETAFLELLTRTGVGYVFRSSTDQEEQDLARWIGHLRHEQLATPTVALPGEYQIYEIQPFELRTQAAYP